MLRRSAQHFLYHNHKQTRLEQDCSLVEVLIIFSHQSRKEKLKGNVRRCQEEGLRLFYLYQVLWLFQ